MLSKHILRVRPKHCTGKKKIEEPLPLFELIIPSIEIPPSVHLPCENPNNLISITEYNRTMGLQSLQELSPPTYRKSGINLKKSASLKQALLSFDSIGSITSLEEGKTEYRLQLPKRPSGKVHSKRLKIQICNFRQQKSGNVTNNYEILEQVGAGKLYIYNIYIYIFRSLWGGKKGATYSHEANQGYENHCKRQICRGDGPKNRI